MFRSTTASVFALVLGLTAVRLQGVSVFTVTNTNDSGAGSLRQAILDSNAAPENNIIDFSIPGPGVHTIPLASPLPNITVPVFIDGYSQPGASPNSNPPGQGFNAVLLVEIDGTAAGTCLTIQAGNSSILAMLVQGLVINRCSGAAIDVLTGGDGAVISGNYIGTDPAGSGAAAGPQGTGIWIAQASGVAVTGNLLSGNNEAVGFVSAPGGAVAGNLIGTDAAGTVLVPNAHDAIDVDAASSNVTIGGSTAGARNVIATGINGIGVYTFGPGTQVLGNYIGTDVTGSIPLGFIFGVYVSGDSSVVQGNLISGGVTAIFNNSTGTSIRGNVIGTDPGRTLSLGNVLGGILEAGQSTVIGGTGAGEGNVVAHNGTPGAGSSAGGVQVYDGSLHVAIRGNSLFDNYPLGIDLLDATFQPGVTPDDACDGDSGANNLQNFPIITAVVPGNTTTHIEGALTAAASTSYDVDLFAAPVCAGRPQAPLEGETYLGSVVVVTDGNCNGTFSTDVLGVLPPGQPVTATATDPSGNTSEFSQSIVLSSTPRSGPAAGGMATTLGGMLFEPGSAVTVGGVLSSNVTYVSPLKLVAATPALAPGSVNDVTVIGPTLTGTLKNGWVADFLDVPQAQQFHDYVVTVVANGIAAGVGGGNYGVADPTLRQQMAVFLLKGKHGVCYAPPPCTGIFSDVPCPSLFADWIEALAGEGITGGCGGGQYCPQNAVRRDQMAAFLLKAEHGSSYAPPPCAGVFSDVACPSLFADWIEELYAEGVTGGCGTNPLIYCPSNPVTRGQMSVFLTKTFFLD
jgi:hypothetical protein